jgi:hypothetical protein
MMGKKRTEAELRRQLHAAEEGRAKAERDLEDERKTNAQIDSAFRAVHIKIELQRRATARDIDLVRQSTDRIEGKLPATRAKKDGLPARVVRIQPAKKAAAAKKAPAKKVVAKKVARRRPGSKVTTTAKQRTAQARAAAKRPL